MSRSDRQAVAGGVGLVSNLVSAAGEEDYLNPSRRLTHGRDVN